ncbi:MAG: AMP-binding protein, partial [Acidobacteria bacterium]|nr:AMP-binding protein [Acidobacteriota bacterium]
MRKGDVCAIFSPNTPEYAIAVLAIARLGAIVTTASPM